MKHALITGCAFAALCTSSAALAKHGDHKDKPLPPGLQKKVANGEPLPPGWQKKYSRGDILERDIYARGRVVVPVGNDGIISVEIDGTIFRLIENTREIVDILSH